MNKRRPEYRYVCVQTHNCKYIHTINPDSQVPSFLVFVETLVVFLLIFDYQPAVLGIVVE